MVHTSVGKQAYSNSAIWAEALHMTIYELKGFAFAFKLTRASFRCSPVAGTFQKANFKLNHTSLTLKTTRSKSQVFTLCSNACICLSLI